jgi:alkyl hydroperoxide reductase subunit AhpC
MRKVRKKMVGSQIVSLIVLLLLVLPLSLDAKKKKVEWVGTEAPNFSLPSSEDRLINYKDDYYGKHYLVITFFPAAFTPI